MSGKEYEFAGVPVRANEFVPVGKLMVAFEPRGRVLLMHPLDLIALRFAGDPIGRLHAAKEYFITRAHRELDALAARLGADTPVEPAEPVVDHPRPRGYSVSHVVVDEVDGFMNRPAHLSCNLQIAHARFEEQQREQRAQRAERTREIRELARRIRESSAPRAGAHHEPATTSAKPTQGVRYKVALVRRLLYGMGFRPKQGSVFYSPSLAIRYSARTAADGFRAGMHSVLEEGSHGER